MFEDLELDQLQGGSTTGGRIIRSMFFSLGNHNFLSHIVVQHICCRISHPLRDLFHQPRPWRSGPGERTSTSGGAAKSLGCSGEGSGDELM